MPDQLQPGDSVGGRYQVQELLGSGGFSVVYGARDQVGRDVAVKVIKSLDRETMARFRREVHLLKTVRSPHVIRVLDDGNLPDGRAFIVFERFGTEDLDALVARTGTLDISTVVVILRQLLHALREAHGVGVVHRDVKPQNVRLAFEPDGSLRAKLLDFGVARLAEDAHPTLTETGVLLGTPRYMSPEQLRGEAVGPASDLYSLGLLCVELLLGPHVLSGNTIGEQIERVMNGPAVTEIATVDAMLVEVLRRMTQRDPLQRYASAESVLAALDSVFKQPTPSSPRAPAEPLSFLARHPIAPYVVLAAAAALVVVLIGSSPWRSQPRRPVVAELRSSASANDPTAPANLIPGDAAANEDAPNEDRSSGCDHDGAGSFVEAFPGAVRLPRSYDNSFRHPVVLLLHQAHYSKIVRGMGPARYIRNTGWAALSDKHSIVILAPDVGLEAGDHPAREIERYELLVDEAARNLCVDRARVFAVGQADAGPLAWRLLYQDWVGAGAVGGFLPDASDSDLIKPPRKPFVMFVSQDSVYAPVDGAPSCTGSKKLPADRVEAVWRQANECTDTTVVYESEQGRCKRWKCARDLQICRMKGGRDWPGIHRVPIDRWVGCAEPDPADFPQSRLIWDFLAGLGD